MIYTIEIEKKIFFCVNFNQINRDGEHETWKIIALEIATFKSFLSYALKISKLT